MFDDYPDHVNRYDGWHLQVGVVSTDQWQCSRSTTAPVGLRAVSNPDDTEETVNLFATLPAYEFFGPVFDWSFLLAAAGAGVGEWARGKMRTAE